MRLGPISSNSGSSGSSKFRSIIDPKVLEKLPTFSGDESRFAEFETVFMSVAGLIGLETSMQYAVDAGTDKQVELSEMADEEVRRQAKALYYMLIQSARGKALRLTTSSEKNNGWALLSDKSLV